ncbi:allantoinase AllB [Salinifilum aidingensis]
MATSTPGTPDTVFRAPRMITPDGEAAGSVAVRDGTITAVDALDARWGGGHEIALGADEVLLPGLVDAHVHVNDPGRAEWEGFPTATRAAAAGGITTILDMPLNSIPPTTSGEGLATKQRSATGAVHVDVGFWGGVVPGNVAELRGLHEAGVFGFKGFLLHSGVDEFPGLTEDDLEKAMQELARHDALLIVHAEDAHTVEHAPRASGRGYRSFLDSRPESAEVTAISRVLELSRRTGCRVHIVHLAAAGALDELARARAEGVPVTVETCPHYLSFCAEEIPDGATAFKCCPPIRDAANRERLWQGLHEGVVDYVVTDHSPCVPELKLLDTGDFGGAWGGIASLQVSLPAVWTQARARGHDLSRVVRWMATEPARVLGVPRKGAIAPGNDADLCVFAPEEAFVVDARELNHRNPVTAYDGRPLAGRVHQTWLRGRRVHGDRERTAPEPSGRLLRRDG